MHYSKNTLILKYGLIAVLLCLIISIFFYYQFFLDEPVFLKHYYDLTIHENSQLNLHIITNSSDNKKIYRIEFPQMPENFAYIELDYSINNDDGYFRSQKFAHYRYNVLSMKVHIIGEKNSEDSVILNKAVVHYSNNDIQEVDLGKIILHKNTKQIDALTSTFGKSSNDNTSATGFKANDNLIIENISSQLDEEIDGVLKLELDGIDVKDLNYPISVAAEDSLRFDSKFKFEPDDERIYNVYDIHKKISLIDSKGNNEIKRILNLNYYPWEVFRTERGIIQYLKKAGVR